MLGILPIVAFAVSTLPMPNGIARVTLKNNLVCAYLNNGNSISHIQFSGQNNPVGLIPVQFDGSSQEKCIPLQIQEYNTPITVYLNDRNKGISIDTHIADFCIEKTMHKIRLVRVVKTENGWRCSEQDWKPEKYYSGLFGNINKFWDWLFNLNGYTKETF